MISWTVTCADLDDAGSNTDRYTALLDGLAAVQHAYDTLECEGRIPTTGLVSGATLALEGEEPILIRAGRTAEGFYDTERLREGLAHLQRQWVADQLDDVPIAFASPVSESWPA